MVTMTELRTMVFANLNEDASQLALDFIDEHTPGELAEVLTEVIRAIQREGVMLIERRTFAAQMEVLTGQTQTVKGKLLAMPKYTLKPDMLAPLRPLMDKSFTVSGSGLRVPWAKATVEQHLARIAYQEQMREAVHRAITRDIEHHQIAVDLIRSAGVECLGDLEAATAVA